MSKHGKTSLYLMKCKLVCGQSVARTEVDEAVDVSRVDDSLGDSK